MITRRTLIIVALMFIIGAPTTAFFALRDSSLDRAVRDGTIRIGYAVEAPFAFVGPDGNVSGESPEVARAVVARMRISNIEWVQTDFDQLIPELESGRFDVIAAGMFITPARARRVAFSQPTFHVEQSLLVRAGNPRGLSSYAQAAQNPDVRIAALSGAIKVDLLRQSGLAESKLVLVPDPLTGRVAVESGLADGLALSAPALRWMLEHDQLTNLEVAAPFVQPSPELTAGLGYGAFAFRKEDRQLRIAWNSAMRPLIGSPEHLRIIAAFGFDQGDLPGAITTEEVIAQ